MESTLVEHYRSELLVAYPGSQIKVAPDQLEMVAVITGELAIAIIERSQPHFHREVIEIYRVLPGSLLVARAVRASFSGSATASRSGPARFITPKHWVIRPGSKFSAIRLGEPFVISCLPEFSAPP